MAINRECSPPISKRHFDGTGEEWSYCCTLLDQSAAFTKKDGMVSGVRLHTWFCGPIYGPVTRPPPPGKWCFCRNTTHHRKTRDVCDHSTWKNMRSTSHLLWGKKKLPSMPRRGGGGKFGNGPWSPPPPSYFPPTPCPADNSCSTLAQWVVIHWDDRQRKKLDMLLRSTLFPFNLVERRWCWDGVSRQASQVPRLRYPTAI